MWLYIKYMTHGLDLAKVEELCKKLKLSYLRVQAGEIECKEQLSEAALHQLQKALKAKGYQLLSRRKSRLIDKIKSELNRLIDKPHAPAYLKPMEIVCDRLNFEYAYLNEVFAEPLGRSIENYFEHMQSEKIKELMMKESLKLSEIARRLSFPSVGQLSKVFKKQTGLAPSYYKRVMQYEN